MEEYRCLNCAMFQLTDDTLKDVDPYLQEGLCRLNPPVLIKERSDFVLEKYKGAWPTVRGRDWCGSCCPK
jgi:hypothetical protein